MIQLDVILYNIWCDLNKVKSNDVKSIIKYNNQIGGKK